MTPALRHRMPQHLRGPVESADRVPFGWSLRMCHGPRSLTPMERNPGADRVKGKAKRAERALLPGDSGRHRGPLTRPAYPGCVLNVGDGDERSAGGSGSKLPPWMRTLERLSEDSPPPSKETSLFRSTEFAFPPPSPPPPRPSAEAGSRVAPRHARRRTCP